LKPPRFRYVAPTTIDEAVAALAEAGDDGKVLAGGQSLIPLLNFRLAYPEVLVDIGRVAGLDHVRVEDDRVVIGAGVTQSTALRDPALAEGCPLLVDALALVAHEAIRNRGTVCGSIAHADPAAELPALFRLLGGTARAVSAAGEREIPADDLFVGPLQSSLGPDELLTEIILPRGATGSIVEHTKRSGDYAIVGVAALAGAQPRVATFGTGPVPQVFDLDGVDGAGEVVADGIDPRDDVHASAEQRRRLAAVLTRRALERAA
jgi:aerobic carbon-monoxide dehydrogenase medium subunit